MDKKPHILIIESQQEWVKTLQQAIPSDTFEVSQAHNYDEAIRELNANQFALAIVDPVLDASVASTRSAGDNHDGLHLLMKLSNDFPQTRLVIVSGTLGSEMMRNAPELPHDLLLVQKQNWDGDRFWSAVSRVLAGETWGPPEPDIDSDETEPLPPVHVRYAGLTGPLTASGHTGPLANGLVPPVVGTRTGKPRVLLIEGDTHWQYKLAQLMDAESFFWRVAGDYEQAMERLGLESFHVVVVDLALADKGTAWQLLDYLVANCPKTKVIVSSGEASRSDVAKLFMHYPIKGFVDKDAFQGEELLDAIREQIAGPALRIQTFGDFRIWRNNAVINDFGDDRAELLIKILITRRGENVSVEELIGALWPGGEAATHSASLGTVISKARTALEPDLPRPNDSNFVIRSGANYLFNFLANVDVDTEQLRHLVSEGRQHERRGEMDQALKVYQAARAVYQGDYLPGERSERWAIQERSTLQALYTDTLNRIADLFAGMDKLDGAIEAASHSLQVDAYNESTYRRLMRYHSCNGDQAAALTVYRTLVKLFSEFFGEDPGVVTKRLFEDISEGRPVECVEANISS